MVNEIFNLFEEFDTNNLIVSDFGIRNSGALITNIILNDDNSVSVWAGDPYINKHAEEIVLDDAQKDGILKEVCDNF